ncbi:polymer-forming cytoskeletal protein [Shewanella algae]|uniref:bactofilin family protein n=1 Tax=Shewanella algae TaxID=38313 RepID=UPI0031F4E0A1
MFGKSKKTTGLTYIAQGSKIIGESHFDGETLVGGAIYGKINAESKLTIEANGLVDGELTCQDLKVSGLFRGKLCCEKLTICGTGTVEGEVASKSMEIFEGGQFIGMRVKEEVNLLKQLGNDSETATELRLQTQE